MTAEPLAVGRHESETGRPQDDCYTLRAHLESASRQSRTPAKGLRGPECPPLLVDLWGAFLELDRARRHGGFGPEPLAYSDIESRSRLTARRLSPAPVATSIAIGRLSFQMWATIKK